MTVLSLPSVTLCAVTSVNVSATVSAMNECQRKAAFADALLICDRPVRDAPGIRRIPIERLKSSWDYSDFMLTRLGDYIETEHVLVVQWDGFILNSDRWEDGFLNFDYIGAPWPQFPDQHQVGNGGFSLRSRRLMQACQDPRFRFAHPEDIAIGRLNRQFLEDEYGCRFADVQTAGRFAYERTAPTEPTFGFHGVFNMIPELGPQRFTEITGELNERTSLNHDYWLLMRQLSKVKGGRKHQLRLTRARIESALGG